MSGNAMTAPAGWVERVRTAAADGTPLWLRGGGTKDFYGRLPAGERFDLTGHAGVVSYEPTELVVSVRGGTLDYGATTFNVLVIPQRHHLVAIVAQQNGPCRNRFGQDGLPAFAGSEVVFLANFGPAG